MVESERVGNRRCAVTSRWCARWCACAGAQGGTRQCGGRASRWGTYVGQDDEHASMEAIGKYFLDRQQQGLNDNLTLAQTMEQGNLFQEEEQQQDEGEEHEEKEMPLNHEQQMALAIMTTSGHFLTSSSPQLRAKMLHLLSQGCCILASHPNKLNPLIHSMWTSIVYRFRDTHNYVVYAAAQLLETLSQISTDFLSSRFEKDLWPHMQHLLQQGESAAKSDSSTTGYSIYSVYNRTQLCLLRTLIQVAYHVPLPQPLIKAILQASQFCCSSLVYQQLNEACHALFDALETQQPDTVWLYRLTSPPLPTSSMLEPIKWPLIKS